MNEGQPSEAIETGPVPAHVVSLTNCLTPYSVHTYTALAKRVKKLTILISTPMESNRNWELEANDLDVRVQRTTTFRRPWRHDAGFTDTVHIHMPRDTIGLLRQLRPDVVISGEFGVRSLLSAVYSTRVRRTPLILEARLSEHTEKGRGWSRLMLRKWLLKQATCVIVNGESGRRYLSGLGFDSERVFDVPYSHPPSVFDRCQVERSRENAHRLLYVGQLIERKGVLPFVAAVDRWAEKHPERAIELDVVGSGPQEGQLRAMRHPQNFTVRIVGEWPYNKLAELYATAGILALPTLADEWAMVVNEAMAAGVPVLGSLYSMAVEELCRDGENGWTFRPDVAAERDSAIDRACPLRCRS